jgi:aryl-alcohol dehydrogenase-like predicted oxidoreductase
MQYRQLGKTGANVSEIGFGAWALGGQWGGQNDADSIAALNQAVDCGVNFIDTAAGYGDGRSERIIGDFLRTRTESLYVATKTPPAAGPWPPSPYCRWQDRYPAAHIRDNLHQRLKNLKLDCVDLLQLHTWTRSWNDDPQPLLVLQKLREEGKLRWIGVSTPEHDQDSVIQLMRDGLVDVVQIIFNLFVQDPAAQILPTAEETGTGVIVRVALDEGALTGKYPANHKFPENDFRASYFAGDRLERTMKRVAEIESDLSVLGIADDYSLTDVSLKFALHPPSVSTVIVGTRNAKQAIQTAEVSEKPPLDDQTLVTLRRHNWRRGIWYAGK